VARNGSYLDVLPSASVRYSITPRVACAWFYGRGLSRPNFPIWSRSQRFSPGGVRTTSSIGNPNLKAEHATILTCSNERSLTPIGLLQAGVFYKRFD